MNTKRLRWSSGNVGLFIFGAGGSYDSVDPHARDFTFHEGNGIRPPLASGLFGQGKVTAKGIGAYAGIRSLAGEVRAATGRRDVEDVLTEFQSRATTERVARQMVSVRYYLRDVLTTCGQAWYEAFDGVNNYAVLTDLIERAGFDEVLLVTFNYDRMVELSLHDVLGMSFEAEDLSDYVSRHYKLIKLHGSVDWGRIVGPRTVTTQSPDEELLGRSAQGVLSEASTEIVRARYGTGHGDTLILPALGIPVKTKDSFECPPSHVGALVDALPRVSRVVIIGWRGADEELPKLLASGLPAGTPIDIVSRADSWKETQDNLRRTGLLDYDYRYATDGFSGFIRMAAAAGALPRHRDLEPTVDVQ